MGIPAKIHVAPNRWAIFLLAIGASLLASPAAAQQDRDCYRARSHRTGEPVLVCRGERGQWEVEPQSARNTRSFRRSTERTRPAPSPPRILGSPLLAPRLTSGRVSAPDGGADQVRSDNIELQKALAAIGCGAGAPDGVWGAQSRRGARCFQRTIGAPQSGLLADDQIAWLKQLANPSGEALDSSARARIGAPPPDSSDVMIEPTELEPAFETAEELSNEPLADAQATTDRPVHERLDQSETASADELTAAAEAADPVSPDEDQTRAVKDPVGLPDLRIDVSQERAPAQLARPCFGDDSAAIAECETEEMNRTDAPEDVAQAWRDQDNRLAAVLGEKPELKQDDRAEAVAPPPTPEAVTMRARQSEIARLAPLLGLDPAELTGDCRQGMRERQAKTTPVTTMFNRVCRAHAYAINDEMLKLGYDARLAAAGDREAKNAMQIRRQEAERARESRAAPSAETTE